MQQINKRIVMSAVALLLVCGVSLSSGSALARHGSDDATTVSTEVENHGSGGSDDTTGPVETEHETEIENHSHDLMELFRQKGKEHVLAQRQERGKARSLEVRQKACEARKAGLTRRMDNAVTAAQRHKGVFDKIYAKVKDFHDAKSLNTPNYDTLVASVDTAQSDADAEIAALKALDITVDCTQVDSLTNSVSAFREAVRSTRDSLKDYRKTIVSLITALHDSAETSSTTNSESN